MTLALDAERYKPAYIFIGSIRVERDQKSEGTKSKGLVKAVRQKIKVIVRAVSDFSWRTVNNWKSRYPLVAEADDKTSQRKYYVYLLDQTPGFK